MAGHLAVTVSRVLDALHEREWHGSSPDAVRRDESANGPDANPTVPPHVADPEPAPVTPDLLAWALPGHRPTANW